VIPTAQGGIFILPASLVDDHWFAKHVGHLRVVFNSRHVTNHFDEGEEVVTGWRRRLKTCLEADNLPPSRDGERFSMHFTEVIRVRLYGGGEGPKDRS
jgi:hypothetical protein